MTFTNDGTCVEKMKSSDEVISAVLTKSRQAQKYMRKLGKVTEAVAAYRLREMKNLQAVENLADYHHPQGNVFFLYEHFMQTTFKFDAQKISST